MIDEENSQRAFSFQMTTNDVAITVVPVFLDEQSDPEEPIFTWAYSITIENLSKRTLQLLNRYWYIVDANGLVNEVQGPGVVGEQPVIEPDDAYEYTSGTHLETPSGIMEGHYEMLDVNNKEEFRVKVPMFSLDSPFQAKRPC